MRTKYRITILLIAVIMLVSFQVEAQGTKLVFNGQLVGSSLKVIKGRTLISVRFISEYFENEIIWDNESKKIRINKGNLDITLQINNRIALINSKPVPLDIQPKLINGQVMVPLRFLTKIYGGSLSWDNSTKLIHYRSNRVNDISIKTSDANTQLIIDTDFIPKYTLKTYYQPKRLVLDLYNVGLKEIQSKLRVNNSMIDQIRISQFKFDPAVVRVVLDIKDINSYRVIEENSKLILQVTNKMKVVTSSIISDYQSKDQEFNLSRRRIVIDPGHGGLDPGAIGVSGLQEKRVNYQLADKVNHLLKQEGFNTIMTRDRNEFVSLSKRAEIANRLNADIFVSIHANSNPKPSINGTATYAHWHASKSNWALAWYIQSEMVARTGLRDNGLKAANFAVLRKTNLPAILVESAFLSNPREERLLGSNTFQTKVAEGIVAGIKKYYANKN